MAFPSASEVPTTSPSHGSTSGGHMESYGAYRRKRYVLSHPRLQLHHPYPLSHTQECYIERTLDHAFK